MSKKHSILAQSWEQLEDALNFPCGPMETERREMNDAFMAAGRYELKQGTIKIPLS
jgi:hypothetical protein